MKRLVALLSVVALLTGACGGDEPEEEQTPDAEEAEAPTVLVGGTNADRTAAFNSFFPKTLSARAGDTVRFSQIYTGEPHTVTFGTVVDAGIAAAEAQTAPGPEPPAMEKVVDIFGPAPTFLPLNQAAGQPCFLESGDPPRVEACPKVEQPEFNGTQSWFNLGLISGDETVELTLADDIEPGTYSFVCVVHRASMSGKLTVVDESDSVPDAAEVRSQGGEDLEKAIEAFRPALDQAAGAAQDNAQAGALSESDPTSTGLLFAPKEYSIPVGGSINWKVLTFHTISINPPPDAFDVLTEAPDGTIQLNQKLGAPSKTEPAPVLFPPTPDLKPVTFDAGSYDGTGFFNSGILASFPPALLTYKLAFSKAGTYEVRCLLHPDMRAKVTVA